MKTKSKFTTALLALASVWYSIPLAAQPGPLFCDSFESCPPPITAPVTASIFPPDGSTDFPVVGDIRIVFSQQMDPATVDAGTIMLEQSGGPAVSGTVSLTSLEFEAVFEPDVQLDFGTEYVLTVVSGESGVQSVWGNQMLQDASASFLTSSPNDSIMVPVSSAREADVIEIRFDRPLDPAAVNEQNFTFHNLTAGGTVVNANHAWDADTQTVSITPIPKMVSADYEVTIETTLTDYLGNPYPVQTTRGFSVSGNSNSGPSVTLGREGDKGHDRYFLDGNAHLMITSVNGDSVTFVDKNLTPVPFVVVDYDTATDRLFIKPIHYLTSALSPYEVAVTEGVTGLSRNSAAPTSSMFAIEAVSPTVVGFIPAPGAVDVPPDTTITVTFDEPMDEGSIDPSTVRLLDPVTPVPGVWSLDASQTVWAFVPDNPLVSFGTYMIDVNAGATDTAGNGADPASASFTVGE